MDVMGNVNEAAQFRGWQEADRELVLADFCGAKRFYRGSAEFWSSRKFYHVLVPGRIFQNT
jgi:hypothetical protein